MLTPVPSQANYSSSCRRRFQTGQTPEELAHVSTPWSVSRATPEKLAFMFRLLCPCIATATMEKSQKKQTRFSVCHCLGAWDWWSGRENTKFEESLSTRRDDGYSAELAGATTNSDSMPRTVGYRRRYDVLMEQTLACEQLHCTVLRPWTSSTRHRDSDSHKKAQQIREPLQFRLRSRAGGAHGNETVWKSTPRGQQVPCRASTRPSAGGVDMCLRGGPLGATQVR